MRLASSHCGSSHDGAMAGGGELSGAVEVATTEAKRARELGEEEEELTAESERGSASSGGPGGGESTGDGSGARG